MKIAFLHYHLKPGGVTTVIHQQIESLHPEHEVLIIAGESVESSIVSSLGAEVCFIESLGYDNSIKAQVRPEKTVEAIVKAIQSKWKNGCDLLHVHNPILAKNNNMLAILEILRKNGIKLFIQVHDFAEDGRPQAYYKTEEYPRNCHYGVINSRDYRITMKSGLKTKGLHLISNMVNLLKTDSEHKCKDSGSHILYPVRAIRRKNIGEAILLSLFFYNKDKLIITLPPNSPADRKSYTGWINFAHHNQLNIEFGAGERKKFADLVSQANYIITTSMSEGFGFCFLEPWTAGKQLFGRKLPDICRDFEKQGIKFESLYNKLFVPVSWIGDKVLFNKWYSCVKQNSDLFNFYPEDEEIQRAYLKMTDNGCIDFGLLDEAFQKKAIGKILSDPGNKNRLHKLNPFLKDFGHFFYDIEQIKHNHNKIREKYNKQIYKQTLINIYNKVATVHVNQEIDKKILMSEFMDLENFSLLKWSGYIE